MKKQDKSKLRLDRETLAPLQGQQLDGVHGGTSPATTTVVPITYTIATKLFNCR
jgi:hypothetical protein